MRKTSRYLFISILFVCFLIQPVFGQSDQYPYNVENPKSLDQVIRDLSDLYNIEFSYPSELIKNQIIPKSDYSSINIAELIDSILSDSDLEFQIIDGNKILLRPKRKTNYSIPKDDIKFEVSGSIQDETGEALSFVDIILDTLFIGTSSDENGNFKFEIPNHLSNRNISFHLVGHESIIKSISDNIDNPITKLPSSIINIQEVILSEKVQTVEFDSTSTSTTTQADYLNNTVSAPIISRDISRSLQMKSGVDATNDLDASIRIRGSQDDETLIILDGIPIYKAEHFYGIFGAINGNHINTVSLHKNNLPLEFGGKTGGLVEMESKNYFNKPTAEIDLNMLTSSITLSAPINKKLSFIASGRTTYNNAADSKLFNWIEPSAEENLINNELESRPLVLNTSPVIRFFDLNGKLIFRPNDSHLFSLSFFDSNDNFDNVYDISYSNPQVNGQVKGQEELNDKEDWQNRGYAIQHSGQFKNNWNIDSRIYSTKFDYSGSLNTSLRLERNNNTFFTSLTNKKMNEINDWGFHSIVSKKVKKNLFSFGVSGINHDVAFNYEADETININVNATGFEAALFSGYQLSLSDEWMINLGGRMDYYSETDKIYFAPRISSRYKTSDNLTLKGAFAKHYQFLREITFYTRLREPIDIFLLTTDGKNNRTYPVGSSINSMLGLTYQKNNWILDTELYHKNMDGVVDHTEVVVGPNQDDNKPPIRQNRAVTGTGRSTGVDISLGYRDKIYEGWLAYTLSKTTNQFEEIFQNESIPSEDDRRHQLKFTNQLTLGKWSITGNYVFASGLSQLNLFDQEKVLDLGAIVNDRSFTRLAPYHRIDLGVNYDFEIQSKKVTLGLSVFNLTNNENVDYVQYLFAVPTRQNNANRNILTGTTTQLLDRTFNLTLRASF